MEITQVKQVTRWLDPNACYEHKVYGIRTNREFCEEIVNNILEDDRYAFITELNGKIAVFTAKFERAW